MFAAMFLNSKMLDFFCGLKPPYFCHILTICDKNRGYGNYLSLLESASFVEIIHAPHRSGIPHQPIQENSIYYGQPKTHLCHNNQYLDVPSWYAPLEVEEQSQQSWTNRLWQTPKQYLTEIGLPCTQKSSRVHLTKKWGKRQKSWVHIFVQI